jgi:hypothetical protein
MPDTFDSDPNTLPPVTKALRQVWTDYPDRGGGFATNGTFAMRGILDAVRALEDRIAALETP